MRSFALVALLGSFVISTSLVAQSLTEHAAAAAGATVGTAAGKPLGNAMGKVFGEVDQVASSAAGTKTPKSAPAKVVAVAPAQGSEHPIVVVAASGVGGAEEVAPGGKGKSAWSHHASGRKEFPADPVPVAAAPITAVLVAAVVEPVVKEPSAQEVASVRVGATASELRTALGAPESKVSIPGDDGHLLEICQYWAKGEQVGTIRLDNGRVVSVQGIN